MSESGSKPVNKATVDELKAEIARREIEKKYAQTKKLCDFNRAVVGCIESRLGLKFAETHDTFINDVHTFVSDGGFVAIEFNAGRDYITMFVPGSDTQFGEWSIAFATYNKSVKGRANVENVCNALFASIEANSEINLQMMHALNAVYNPKVGTSNG